MRATFVRFQSPEVSERGINVGVFGLVNLLGKQGLLSVEDEQWRRERNRWLDEAYTDPSTVDRTVYDREINPGAFAWFKKDTAARLVAATLEHFPMLDRYSIAWERVESDTPAAWSTRTSTRSRWFPMRDPWTGRMSDGRRGGRRRGWCEPCP